MSKKDFEAYYSAICKQYFDLNEVMKDLSEEVSKGMKTPECIDQLKLTIAPVQNNYKTLSYIKYLLDKPSRDTKVKRYNRSNKHLLMRSMGRQAKDLIQENELALRDANIEFTK